MQFLLSLHEKCSKGHRKMNLPASVKKTRVRITSLNLRCSSRAVSLYNAHFSWLWTAVAASIKPNTNEIGTINLILTKQKIIKRAISAQAHARASGRKQPDKSTPNFFTFKCQQPFDSYGSFVLRIVLMMITEDFFLRCFLSCLPLEFFLRGFTVSSYQRRSGRGRYWGIRLTRRSRSRGLIWKKIVVGNLSMNKFQN